MFISYRRHTFFFVCYLCSLLMLLTRCFPIFLLKLMCQAMHQCAGVIDHSRRRMIAAHRCASVKHNGLCPRYACTVGTGPSPDNNGLIKMEKVC